MRGYLKRIAQTAGLVCCFLWVSPGDVLARNGGDSFLQGYVMELGRIVMNGSSDRLKESEDIKSFYLGHTDEGARGEKRWKRKKTWR
jgi:branched-chain amino acid transport system ATP-binding protein